MRVLVNGAEPEAAKLIVILLYGRGADGNDILGLSSEFEDDDICWLAPTAMNNQWYPGKIGDRRSQSEPFLTISAEQIKGLMAEFPPEKIVLGGFSQGACMTADILARYPQELAGAWMFSGGLIGSEEELPEVTTPYNGLPVTISGSEKDPHIPIARMRKTAEHLKEMGADVEVFHYDVPTHQIAEEEIDLAKRCLKQIKGRLRV